MPSAARHSVPGIAKRGFRRSAFGYDPDEVREAIASRDARVARLEREASNLAERILDRERRLQAALGRLGEKGDDGVDSPGAITAITRRLEEIHEGARHQADRIRSRALRDAVQIADRVTELAGLSEMMKAAGLRPFAGQDDLLDPGSGEGEVVSMAAREGFFEGKVEVDIGPLNDFAELSSIEDAANAIGAAGEIKVKRFSGGRATLSMDLGEPVELLRELEERAPLEFRIRSLKDDRVVLDVDVDEADEAEAA